MKKNILTFDFARYNHNDYDKYAEEVQKLFKHRNIRLTNEKVKLIEEICEKLPITLVGDEARNVKVKSIIIIINQLLFLKKDEVGALNYRTKKVRTVKDGQEFYTTMYSFYFEGDRRWDLK